MLKNGIDVSEHQGKINWSAVKTDFVIIRAGYGKDVSQKDAFFETNYKECKNADIPAGAYWYSYALSVEDAKKEAETCLSVIKGKQFEYPVYFDIEEKKQLALGKEKCSEIAQAFLETVEKAGYWVGIYSSKSHLENYISEEIRNRYAVWVAHYGISKTTYSGAFGMWQKSSSGSISGISGSVDLNECYVDYPAQIKAAGLNGFSAQSTENSAESVTLTKGQVVRIKANTPIFANETATTASSRIASGTYYLYDGILCKNHRYRITTKSDYCGKTPVGRYVTGFVSADNFE